MKNKLNKKTKTRIIKIPKWVMTVDLNREGYIIFTGIEKRVIPLTKKSK